MKWLIVLFLVTSCGEDSVRTPQHHYVRYSTLDRIQQHMESLEQIKREERWDREAIERKVRNEFNENSICEAVLAKLKKRKESMTNEAWNICDTEYPVVIGRFLEIRIDDEQ